VSGLKVVFLVTKVVGITGIGPVDMVSQGEDSLSALDVVVRAISLIFVATVLKAAKSI
jgi:hypothetical protein